MARLSRIQQIDAASGDVIREWSSMTEAAASLGITYQGVQSRLLRGTARDGTFLHRVDGPAEIYQLAMQARNARTGETVEAKSSNELAAKLADMGYGPVAPATLRNWASGGQPRLDSRTQHLRDWDITYIR